MTHEEVLRRALAAEAARISKTAARDGARAAAKPNDYEESIGVSTISEGHEDISILGTGIDKIPGLALPEFDGLRIGEDRVPVARIIDGALCIEVDDIDVAIAWRNAWQNAVSHLVIHRQRQEGQS